MTNEQQWLATGSVRVSEFMSSNATRPTPLQSRICRGISSLPLICVPPPPPPPRSLARVRELTYLSYVDADAVIRWRALVMKDVAHYTPHCYLCSFSVLSYSFSCSLFPLPRLFLRFPPLSSFHIYLFSLSYASVVLASFVMFFVLHVYFSLFQSIFHHSLPPTLPALISWWPSYILYFIICTFLLFLACIRHVFIDSRYHPWNCFPLKCFLRPSVLLSSIIITYILIWY